MKYKLTIITGFFIIVFFLVLFFAEPTFQPSFSYADSYAEQGLLIGPHANGIKLIDEAKRNGLGNLVWIPKFKYYVGAPNGYSEPEAQWSNLTEKSYMMYAQEAVDNGLSFIISSRRGLGDGHRHGNQLDGPDGSGEILSSELVRKLKSIGGSYFAGLMMEEMDADWIQNGLKKDTASHPYIDDIYAKRTDLAALYNFSTRDAGRIKFETELKRLVDRYHDWGVNALVNMCITYQHYGFRSGADMVMLELLEHLPNVELQLAYTRGAAREYNKPWGVWVSPWSAGTIPSEDEPNESDKLWKTDYQSGLTSEYKGHTAADFKKAVYLSYYSGAKVITQQENDPIFQKADGASSVNWDAGPWGKVLRDFNKFVGKNPVRGTPHVGVAVMLDENGGWSPGRLWGNWAGGVNKGNSLDPDEGTDQIWAKLSPEKQDFMLRNYLNVYFPDYWKSGTDAMGMQNSPYNNRFITYPGFFTTNPLGQVDVILNDAPLQTMVQYPFIVYLGHSWMSDATLKKLRAYVYNGGTLLINAKQLFDASGTVYNDTDLFGATVGTTSGTSSTITVSGNEFVTLPQSYYSESTFTIINTTTGGGTVLATDELGRAILYTKTFGSGRTYLTTPEFMVSNDSSSKYPALNFGKDLLMHLSQRFNPVKVTNGGYIEYMLNEAEDGSKLILLVNHGSSAWSGDVTLIGTVADRVEDLDSGIQPNFRFKDGSTVITTSLSSNGVKVLRIYVKETNVAQETEGATVTSTTGAYSAAESVRHVIDGILGGSGSAYVSPDNPGLPQDVTIRLKEPQRINKLSLYTSYGLGYGIKDFTIQTSEDGVNWTVVYSKTGEVWNTNDGTVERRDYAFTTGTTTARFIRLHITNFAYPMSHFIINEIQVWKPNDVKTYNAALAVNGATIETTGGQCPDFTANTKDKMIDGRDCLSDSAWASSHTAPSPASPVYVTVTLPRTYRIDGIGLFENYAQGQGITNFEIQYFTGSIWSTVKTVSETWNFNDGTEEARIYRFTPVNASQVRLKITGANQAWGHYTIDELQIFGADTEVYGEASVLVSSQASASSTAGYYDLDHQAAKMVDGTWGGAVSGYASSDGISFPQYLTLDLNSTYAIDRVTLFTNYGAGQGITSFNIQISSNGTEWTTVWNVSDSVLWSYADGTEEIRSFQFPRTLARYVRLQVNGANMAWNHFSVDELQVWGQTIPVDANQALNAQVSSEAGTYQTGYEPAKMIDGTNWAYASQLYPSLPANITFTLDQPKHVNKLVLYTNCGRGQGITDFDIMASGDGNSWWTLQKVTTSWECNDGNQLEAKVFEFPGVYTRYLRIRVKGCNLAWNKFSINEVQWLGENNTGLTNLASGASISSTIGAVDAQHPITKAVDGQVNTPTSDFVSENVLTASPRSITFNLGGTYSITAVKLLANYGKGMGPTDIIIQISTNGTDFVNVASDTSIAWSKNKAQDPETKTYAFTAQQASHVRLVIRKANLSWSHFGLDEVQILDNQGNNLAMGSGVSVVTDAGQRDDYTSINNINDGFVSQKGTKFDTQQFVYRNCDNGDDPASVLHYCTTHKAKEMWTDAAMTRRVLSGTDSTSQYITATLNNTYTVNKVILRTELGRGLGPASFIIQTSMDGNSWDDKVTVIDEVWEQYNWIPESKTYTFSNTNARYVRLKVTKANMWWNHWGLEEFEVYNTSGINVAAASNGGVLSCKYYDGTDVANAPMIANPPETFTIDKANDGSYGMNVQGYVSKNDIGFPQDVILDLGAGRTFSKIMIYENGGRGRGPTGFDIQVSDNGTSWHTIKSCSYLWSFGSGLEEVFTCKFEPVTKRYIRLHIKQAKKTGGQFAIDEIQVW